MYVIPWEAELSDWTSVEREGVKATIKDVLRLISAPTEDQAYESFQRIWSAICHNKVVYEDAQPVTRIVLSVLPHCSIHAREWCLELLSDIATGTPHASAPDVVRRCLEEMRHSTWYFVYGLQFDTTQIVLLYIDIVGTLGLNFPDFRPKAVAYLQKVLTRELSSRDLIIAEATIAKLNKAG